MRLLITEPLAVEPAFLAELRRLDPSIETEIWVAGRPPRPADILVAWDIPGELDLGRLPLKALFCFGAGTDHLFAAPNLPAHLPVLRLLDEGQAQRMFDYALMAALERSFALPGRRRDQRRRHWGGLDPRTGRGDLVVAVLGLGFIGSRIATRFHDAGFRVRGWSREARRLPGIVTSAGPAGIAPCAAGADVLVSVLPGVAALRGILDLGLFGRLAPGAHVVNLGRGLHLDETDLARALDDGRLDHAWLDVLIPEPPASDHWAWQHPKVTLTPHVAGIPTLSGAAASLAAAVDALRAGRPLPGLVRPSAAG